MKILLLAGEESGVIYAERLKESLKALAGQEIEFAGYDTEGFRSEVAHLAEKLEQWNAENIGNIQLEQAQYEFIAEYTGIDNWEGQ